MGGAARIEEAMEVAVRGVVGIVEAGGSIGSWGTVLSPKHCSICECSRHSVCPATRTRVNWYTRVTYRSQKRGGLPTGGVLRALRGPGTVK